MKKVFNKKNYTFIILGLSLEFFSSAIYGQAAPDVLVPGQELRPGQYLCSSNKLSMLEFRSDYVRLMCKTSQGLINYNTITAATSASCIKYVDGVPGFYQNCGQATPDIIFSKSSVGGGVTQGNAEKINTLIMQTDFNLVTYGSSGAKWASNTVSGNGSCPGATEIDMCKDATYEDVRQMSINVPVPPIMYSDPKNKMVLSPRTYRPQPNDSVTNAADAVLVQTSYLAKVMIQANDVLPPSHVSSRSSGEVYQSSQNSIKYNSKVLSERSTFRNALGAFSTSLSSDSAAENSYDTVVRDWVEYHIDQYCDPLAATVGPHGLNNCNFVYKNLPASAKVLAKDEGKTAWELVAEYQALNGLSGIQQIPAGGRKPSYAADITAHTLFNNNIEPHQAEAAMRYIFNITKILPKMFNENEKTFTVPKELMTDANPNSGQQMKVLTVDGYKKYIRYMESQSKLSLGQYILMQMFSERLQLNNIKIPKVTWDAEGNKKEEMVSTSLLGLLEFESNKRFRDPAWYDRLQQMPSPAIQKEMAYMMSLQLAMQYKQYEQQQYQNALFAVLAGSMDTAMEFMNKVNDPEQQNMEDLYDNANKKFQDDLNNARG